MLIRQFWAIGLALGTIPMFAAPPVPVIPDPPPAVTKKLPESIAELKEFEKQTKAVLEKVIPCTVSLQVGGASGSGVIISEDGYVLTAAHVSGTPDKVISIILPDGRRVKAKTLGLNGPIDSGMVKITDEGKWPYCKLGHSKDLKPGEWCIAVGHPGGFKKGRSPVVRVGRIGFHNNTVIQTDCTLVGGDSGGPLFDMKGQVIGIHSRIGFPIFTNFHVPADIYHETWESLVKGTRTGDGYMGVSKKENVKGVVLKEITEKSPAADAGLKADDVIVKFGNKEVKTYEEMVFQLQLRSIGEEVPLVVKRGEETVELKIKLGKRPE